MARLDLKEDEELPKPPEDLQSYLASKYSPDMGDALRLENDQRFYNNLGKAFNTVGTSLGTPGQKVDNSFYDEQNQQAQMPVKIESEREKMVRDFLKDKYNSGIKKLELEKSNKMLEETLRHNRATEDLSAKELGLKREKEARELPDGAKQASVDVAKGAANKVMIAQQIDSYLERMKTADEDTKLQLGRQMIKVLNSTEGKDAVGAEESKRLASKLQFAFGNLFNDNSVQFGRDLEGFMDDAKATSDVIKSTAGKSMETFKGMTGRALPLEIPRGPSDENIKVVGGTKYRKVPGGWEEVE